MANFTNAGVPYIPDFTKSIDYAALSKLTAADVADIPTNEKQGIINTNAKTTTPTTSSYTGSIGDTLRESSNYYAANNPGASAYVAPAQSNTSSSSGGGNTASTTPAPKAQAATTNYGNAKKVTGGYEVLVPDDPGNTAFGTYSKKFIPDDQVTVNSSSTKSLGSGATETTFNISVGGSSASTDSSSGGSSGASESEITVQSTLDDSSNYYKENNPGAQNFQEYLEEKISEQNNEESSEQSSSSVYDSEEYKALLSRIEELEQMVAANNATTQTSTNIQGRDRQGLIKSIISGDSVLIDSGSMKLGGQVYGPDGSVYPSVTDAIQAGVFNYTYFPLSTGVKQENQPLRKRTIAASTNTPSNNNPNFLGMGNQGG